MLKKILFLVISVLYINSISAQKPAARMVITGTVLDVYNGPIANAMIMIDDRKTNSVTDSKGNFRIKVNHGASKIVVITPGNGIIEEYIRGRNRIIFNFSTINQLPYQYAGDGEQGVNTGYGMVKKKNLTTDIDNIDGTHKKYSTYASITEMIQREVSGVSIYGNDIVIQGSRNYVNGFVYPLIVVDGVYMDRLPDIPPVTVKSIEVLKGTSAAIYGSRGYGGAIIIKTKLQN